MEIIICPFCKSHLDLEDYYDELDSSKIFFIECSECEREFEVSWDAEKKQLDWYVPVPNDEV